MISARDEFGAFERDVLPALFDPAEKSEHPTLLVLAGAPGTSARRAVPRSVGDVGLPPLISAGALRSFHPDFAAAEATIAAHVDGVVTAWLRDTLQYARTQRRSIIIDGLDDPDLVGAVARQFAESGFDARLIVVASPASRALLGSASVYTDGVRAGRPTQPPVTRPQFDAGVSQVTDLLHAAGSHFDHITIFNDRGEAVHDAPAEVPGGGAFDQATRRFMTGLEAAQWLGELRRVTEFAQALRTPDVALTGALIEIHELGLRDVTPYLPVPRGSEVTSIEEARLATHLAALKRLRSASAPAAELGPVVAGPEPGRGIAR